MGVTGLWSLIEDAGTRVDVQTLNQKILAIGKTKSICGYFSSLLSKNI